MDVAAWNTLLDCAYGPSRAAAAPDAFEVALLETADPGSELAGAGYARPTLDNDDWLPAAEAVKTTTYAPSFGTPTDAWEIARFYALIDGSTVWNVVPLFDDTGGPLTVTGAGDPVTVLLSIAAGGVFEG